MKKTKSKPKNKKHIQSLENIYQEEASSKYPYERGYHD